MARNLDRKTEADSLCTSEIDPFVRDPSRFLRARKFDVQGAYAQFTSAEDWRRTERIDQLYDSFSLPEFEMARQLYPQWTGRRDNSGLPVYVFEVASLTKEKTDPYSKDSSRLEPRIVALYEVREHGGPRSCLFPARTRTDSRFSIFLPDPCARPDRSTWCSTFCPSRAPSRTRTKNRPSAAAPPSSTSRASRCSASGP